MGRPPKYKTPEQLQVKIDDYFDKHPEIQTITGLILHCDFCDRSSFYAYEQKPEFKYTIKKARTRITAVYESKLHGSNVAGAIFALKNMGWSDKKEIEHSGNVTIEPKEWVE